MSRADIFILIATLTAIAAAVWAVRRSVFWRIRGINTVWLEEIRARSHGDADPLAREAWSVLADWAGDLHGRWFLIESDLDALDNTRRLLERIAAVFHPRAAEPVLQIRFGRLFEGGREIGKRLLSLAAELQPLQRIRLRHVLLIARAWEARRRWESTVWAERIRRYRVFALIRWTWYLLRWADAGFWMLKTARGFVEHLVCRELLLHWYLIIGREAVPAYADRGAEPDDSALDEEALAGFDPVADFTETDAGMPEAIREKARAARQEILFAPGAVEWDSVRSRCKNLAEDIARHFHPQSAEPLHEAELHKVILSAAEFASDLAALEQKPVLNLLLRFRLSHLFIVQETVARWRDYWLYEQINKYHLQRVARYARALFELVVRRHPGVLLKEFLFTLATEGVKRHAYAWACDRVAREAWRLYRTKDKVAEKNALREA